MTDSRTPNPATVGTAASKNNTPQPFHSVPNHMKSEILIAFPGGKSPGMRLIESKECRSESKRVKEGCGGVWQIHAAKRNDP